MKEEYVDITKTGPVPLKGLNYQDDSDNLGSFERLVLSGNRTMLQKDLENLYMMIIYNLQVKLMTLMR